MSGWVSRAAGAFTGFLAAIGALACGASSEIPGIPEGALIVDVRSAAEYQSGHFPGARNIPVGEVGARIAEFGDKDQPVVVYCRAGRRAAAAKAQLEKEGFTNVVNGGSLEAMLKLSPGASAEK